MKSFLLLIVYFACIALGISGIVWVASLTTFSLTKAILLSVLVIGFIFYISLHQNPLKFSFYLVLIILPILGAVVPPARLQFTVFDLIGFMIFIILIFSVAKKGKQIDLFPFKFLWIPILFVVPSVALSTEHVSSSIQLLRLFEIYALFIAGYYFLQQPNAMSKFHVILASGLLVVSLFVILQKVLGFNLMLYQERGEVSAGGVLIRQGSGLFQDPQKAGQFIAVLFAYFSILHVRKALIGKWLKRIVYAALIISAFALLLTVSRLAIASGFAVVVAAFFFLSKINLFSRFLLGSVSIMLLILMIVMGSKNFIRMIVPSEVAIRFELAESSGQGRYEIWKNTFHVFTDNPVVGIGLGSYRGYLIRSDPVWKRYSDMGGVVPIQPESGYLKVLYEVGIIGAFGFLYFLFIGVGGVVREIMRSKSKEVVSVSWAVLGGLTIYMATFTTLFTPSDPRNAVLPILLILAARVITKIDSNASSKTKQLKLNDEGNASVGLRLSV